MDKKTFYLLFFLFSLLFSLPVWLFPFLPFVDLPQHLHFASILKNYSPELPSAKIYSLRLFPMHNTLHLFSTYLLSLIFPLEISNKIYLTLSLILFPLSLLFLIKILGGNEYFSLFGFLLSYNYNLFWGFVGLNLGMALILFLIGYEIKYLREKRKGSYLFPISLLFFFLFFAHSLVYIFASVTYLLIFTFNSERRPLRWGLPLLIPWLISFFALFLPWQIEQFRGEGSELQQQFRQYISLPTLYNNLWEFFRRIGLKTDETYIFILKVLFVFFLLTTLNRLRQKKINSFFRDNYRYLTIFFLTTLLFYLFFPGRYKEAVFLNERFAPLLFLLLIAFLALNLANFNHWALKLFTSLIISLVGLNLGIRIFLFNQEAKPIKAMFAQLPEGKKLAGLIYQKRPKADFFGYDVFLHFPTYYAINKNGLSGFTFAYIRYSPIVYQEPYPLPQIDEWETWHSVFPEGWEEYDYFLVSGEPRLSDRTIIDKWKKIEERGIWTLYEIPPEIKPAKEE